LSNSGAGPLSLDDFIAPINLVDQIAERLLRIE
jgi:hypothetical protein